MPYFNPQARPLAAGRPSAMGAGVGAQRNAIAQAMMNIQRPPPQVGPPVSNPLMSQLQPPGGGMPGTPMPTPQMPPPSMPLSGGVSPPPGGPMGATMGPPQMPPQMPQPMPQPPQGPPGY
jgi:hypothetical protein